MRKRQNKIKMSYSFTPMKITRFERESALAREGRERAGREEGGGRGRREGKQAPAGKWEAGSPGAGLEGEKAAGALESGQALGVRMEPHYPWFGTCTAGSCTQELKAGRAHPRSRQPSSQQPQQRSHPRAHRLMNSSATGGLPLRGILRSLPEEGHSDTCPWNTEEPQKRWPK